MNCLARCLVDIHSSTAQMVANAGAHYLAAVTECSSLTIRTAFLFALTRMRFAVNEHDWDRVFSVNVKGVMFCYKHAAIQMIKQGCGGRIIGAASTASKQGAPYDDYYF